MKKPCAGCSFDENKCIFHGHCKAMREYKQAQTNRRHDNEFAAYQHDKKTAAIRAARPGSLRPAWGR